ncbi:MAG: AAA family ATPase [Kiritimatiellae bacterium]|nr:AAA family ATPase [Kiritimatiellia bacterium]
MFFGRQEQLNEMALLWNKGTSSLVTCRGRRRIGKSTLIRQFAQLSNARFIKIEGLKPRRDYGNGDELRTFASQLAAQTGSERTPPEDWLSAFIRLAKEIRPGEKTVILLDEISWLGHYDTTFADTIKIAWDNYWKVHDRLVVVLCGSVSSWIRENIIDNGEFVGRRSLDIVVNELPLSDCVRFWGTNVERISPTEILDVLSVTGGVPRYLEEIVPGLSAAENIRRLCFSPKGVLREDFDDMFTDVITHQPRFTCDVLRTLVGGKLNATEIAAMLKIEKGGRLTEALKRLEESGFIACDRARNPETGELIREKSYRLKDNYSRFYLKYVEPSKDVIDGGAYDFGSLERLDGWDSMMGLAFENLVINNFRKLIPLLHLSGALITSAAPFRRVGKKGEGVQIDLLLQAKRFVYLIEIKRRREIGREVMDEMDEKRRRLTLPRELTVRTALVYDGHLAPSVEAEGYFDAIVESRSLLLS